MRVIVIALRIAVNRRRELICSGSRNRDHERQITPAGGRALRQITVCLNLLMYERARITLDRTRLRRLDLSRFEKLVHEPVLFGAGRVGHAQTGCELQWPLRAATPGKHCAVRGAAHTTAQLPHAPSLRWAGGLLLAVCSGRYSRCKRGACLRGACSNGNDEATQNHLLHSNTPGVSVPPTQTPTGDWVHTQFGCTSQDC
jgi:hypothetical protein